MNDNYRAVAAARAAYERVDRLNNRAGTEVVTFDGHGDDMSGWYRGVGTAISLSDLESFHLTLPDGAASGAAPVSLAWPGADLIYPREWLDHVDREHVVGSGRAAFDRAVVFDRLAGVLTGRSTSAREELAR